MADEFQDMMQSNLAGEPEESGEAKVSDKDIIDDLNTENEKEYYSKLKKKNKNYLVQGLTLLEKERISKYLCDRYDEAYPKHKELCDRLDDYDDVFRMERQTLVGDDGNMPNYRTPLTAVTCEVVHANIMNTFFSPSEIMRVLPTEEADMPKVNKLSRFGNWSMENEMHIFEGIDRLFHASAKNGESPYMVHWEKKYGTEIVRKPLMNPANPTEPMYDEDTKEILYQEVEEQKLLENCPRLEALSRRDVMLPPNAIMDVEPEYIIRKVRLTYDDVLRLSLEGKVYSGAMEDITDWGGTSSLENSIEDYQGDTIPVGKYSKDFWEFYIRLRIKVIKDDKETDFDEYEELEGEYIALQSVEDDVLLSLRVNKFPLKMRPIAMDYFMPDDEGRRSGRGIAECLDGIQTCYDALFNQYLFGIIQANNPFGFFTPMANQRAEPLKIKNGYLFPTNDPSSINIVTLPGPSNSIQQIMEIVTYWGQMLFGTSDYSAGMESKIDPSAPAKKAEIVVQQGNVRMNLIIKRKIKTLKDIFLRWYLLYKDNMPPNKFMRIVGDNKDNPWKFDPVTLSDFALTRLPDFELTGNVLNQNKQVEINKVIGLYQLLRQDPFFNPQTRDGMMAHYGLTKWLIENLDTLGLSRMLPKMPGNKVYTPEEENAHFLQNTEVEPEEGEDYIYHLKTHQMMLMSPTVTDAIKPKITKHMEDTIKLMQSAMQKQAVMAQMQQPPMGMTQQGGINANAQGNAGSPAGEAQGMAQGQPAGMV